MRLKPLENHHLREVFWVCPLFRSGLLLPLTYFSFSPVLWLGVGPGAQWGGFQCSVAWAGGSSSWGQVLSGGPCGPSAQGPSQGGPALWLHTGLLSH